MSKPIETMVSRTPLHASVVRVGGQRSFGESVFPFVAQCDSTDAAAGDAEAWVAEQKANLLALASKHGAVLLRGFPISDVEIFDTVVRALCLTPFPYSDSLSNAVRVNRTERVFSANEAPPEVEIFFHHEMAQTPMFPQWLIFHCEVAAASGGATPICRSDVLYETLRKDCPGFIRDCESKGLEYSNTMPETDDADSGMGRSWRSTLSVEDRAAAEDRLGSLHYRWEWSREGSLRVTTPALPAVMEVSPGRKSFFNQIIAAYRGWKDERNDPSTAIRHGDGSALDASAVGRAIEIANDLAFDLDWQVGDWVIVDNRVSMHARHRFSGTRKIVASLAEMQTQAFSPTV